jgi:hypothetical protein
MPDARSPQSSAPAAGSRLDGGSVDVGQAFADGLAPLVDPLGEGVQKTEALVAVVNGQEALLDVLRAQGGEVCLAELRKILLDFCPVGLL